MKNSFVITRAEFEASDAVSLAQEIARGTGSEVEAQGILRSLQRMNVDPSIRSYEIMPVRGGRLNGGKVASAWRVRAERGTPDDGAAARGTSLPA